jgi:predicted kinase
MTLGNDAGPSDSLRSPLDHALRNGAGPSDSLRSPLDHALRNGAGPSDSLRSPLDHALRLVQMAGWMGTGKSTIARAVSTNQVFVVLDHDTTKSALLVAGVPHPPAGAASYEILFRLAEDLLRQGHSVLIDSPSLYSSIPDRGLAIAHIVGARYYFVECNCPDNLSESRLLDRNSRLSQVATQADATAIRNDPARVPHRPDFGALMIDTSRNIDQCVQEILHYLDGPGVSSN